jgi:hypothetical protein
MSLAHTERTIRRVSKARRWPRWVVALPVLTLGCETFQLHDAERLEAAKQAATLANTISSENDPVFEPMLENLDRVARVQPGLQARDDESFMKSFREELPDLTALQLGEHLFIATAERLTALESIEKKAGEAAEAVNETLDRQKQVTAYLKDGLSEPTDIEQTLGRVEERIAWIEGRLAQVDELASVAGSSDGLGGVLRDAQAADLQSEGVLASAKSAIDDFQKDPQLEASRKLIKEATEEITEAEAARLAEMQRHLKEVRRILDDQRTHDQIAVCSLHQRAIGNVYPAIEGDGTQVKKRMDPKLSAAVDKSLARTSVNLEDEIDAVASVKADEEIEKYLAHLRKLLKLVKDVPPIGEQTLPEAIRTLQAGLLASHRYDGYREIFGDEQYCFSDPDPKTWLAEKDYDDVAGFWRREDGKPATLAEFTANDISALGADSEATVLVASLGILVQHEYVSLRDAEMSLGRELHRHSILLSRINARQRSLLVAQLAEGLQVYFEGGIKPEELAQLILMGGQVGALTAIGVQQ